MDKDLFKYLPSEIVFVIFSKLPIRSIAICKCVCKSWLNLVGSYEFVKFHLSQSTPCLVIGSSNKKGSFKIIEDPDLECHELHYRPFTEFIFPHVATLRGSANGLLFFDSRNYKDRRLYICNPITRDYMKLPKKSGKFGPFDSYGFGASKKSGQHKVVRIFHGYKRDKSGRVRATKSECHVYTLGTRSWRSIAASSGEPYPLNYGNHHMHSAAFVNGNLHWLVYDDDHDAQMISCFDLEAEAFSTFPPPPHEKHCGRLSSCVVGNWLCFCERIDGVMSIWLAKEEKCWTKEFVITSSIIYRSYPVYPIKVFIGGDILIAPCPYMSCYSTKTTKPTRKLDIFDQLAWEAINYTPSFLSLKSFGIQNTISL